MVRQGWMCILLLKILEEKEEVIVVSKTSQVDMSISYTL